MTALGAQSSGVVVFIASSDNTRDVFDRVYPAFRKHWPDCGYPVYVGCNTPPASREGFEPLYAHPSGWRTELMAQLEQISARHVILFLDDFLVLRKVADVRVRAIVQQAVDADLDYLRLIPLRRAIVPRLMSALHGRRDSFELIPPSDPYYSALQIVLWKRSHLLNCLRLEANIWRFEGLMPPNSAHYVIRTAPPIPYRHIVEKGRWMADASALLQRAGVPAELGSRARWPWTAQLSRWMDLARFEVFGYSIMRTRLALEARRKRRELV